MDFWIGLLVGAILGSMASMDFKVTFDWRGKLLYILNVIDHERRELVVSRATHNPSSDWVAQQIRDAYPFDEAPKLMLLDHDSIFIPLVNTTLPNMGIKVVRTSVGCPWQNGVVERFNRTLTEELLDHTILLKSGTVILQSVTRNRREARPME